MRFSPRSRLASLRTKGSCGSNLFSFVLEGSFQGAWQQNVHRDQRLRYVHVYSTVCTCTAQDSGWRENGDVCFLTRFAARMKIQFKTVQGEIFAFEFEPSDTVSRSPPMAGMKNRVHASGITLSQISPTVRLWLMDAISLAEMHFLMLEWRGHAALCRSVPSGRSSLQKGMRGTCHMFAHSERGTYR